jgi:hypothetical protein
MQEGYCLRVHFALLVSMLILDAAMYMSNTDLVCIKNYNLQHLHCCCVVSSTTISRYLFLLYVIGGLLQ